MSSDLFFARGWQRFDYDPPVAEWLGHALPFAQAAVTDPAHAAWHRCGGTWFAGVNALPNDNRGAVGASGPLRGTAINFIREYLGLEFGLGETPWDQAQVSVCFPGYPQPMASESASAFNYRRNRDAAHVDGLLPEGPHRRRHLREHHGFILGLPLVASAPRAAPLVVWEGSHEFVRQALLARFDGIAPTAWGSEDVTSVYHQTRQQVFDRCRRIELAARPGEAYLVHRLALHGIAPWGDTPQAGADGRMICYFRPDIGDPMHWLTSP